jgi:hypothetical protein
LFLPSILFVLSFSLRLILSFFICLFLPILLCSVLLMSDPLVLSLFHSDSLLFESFRSSYYCLLEGTVQLVRYVAWGTSERGTCPVLLSLV